jgi:hypothetical protein
MLSNRLAFAALAIACMGAAAGGGYLATRQNTVPTPASAETRSPVTAPAAAAASAVPATTASSPDTPVRETEAVIGDTAPARPSQKAPAAKPVDAPARPVTRDTRTRPPLVAHQEAPPVSATPAPQPPAAMTPPVETAPPPRAEERAAPEPTRAPEPPARTFAEYVVSADSVIGLQTENRLSSETSRVEDRVDARVTRDVRAGDHVAIPAGTRALGSVMQVERGGKFKERARLGVRFHTLVLADGTRIPISTETIFREGDAPSSQAKVGGAAVGGAILGAILGGAKGMAIGAATGAGAGTAAVAASDRNAATLPAGTSISIRILQPITVSGENKEE